MERYRDLRDELGAALGRLQQIVDTDIAAFNARARELGAEALVVPRVRE